MESLRCEEEKGVFRFLIQALQLWHARKCEEEEEVFSALLKKKKLQEWLLKHEEGEGKRKT